MPKADAAWDKHTTPAQKEVEKDSGITVKVNGWSASIAMASSGTRTSTACADTSRATSSSAKAAELLRAPTPRKMSARK